ncbi:MAG TPA: DUF2490 domain-containing protein [Novosphingobium sp.]
MRRLLTTLLAVSATVATTPARADDSQAWGTTTVQVGMGGPWRLSNETVVRSSDARGLYEIENNLMVGYKTDPHVTLWLGYTLDPNYLHGSLTVTEHRFRQQVSFDNFAALGPVRFNGRMRLEERWRDGQAGTGWRLRPYVKASLPLYGKTALVFTHESFIDLNAVSFQKTAGYDRWRTGLGVSAPLSRHVSVEAGYLNQHIFVRNGPDTDDHILNLGLTAAF